MVLGLTSQVALVLVVLLFMLGTLIMNDEELPHPWLIAGPVFAWGSFGLAHHFVPQLNLWCGLGAIMVNLLSLLMLFGSLAPKKPEVVFAARATMILVLLCGIAVYLIG
jgi:hypothetical protein